jgi:hypothetical protein
MAGMMRCIRWVALGAGALGIFVTLACSGGERAAGEGPYANEVADAIPSIERITGLKYKQPPVLEERTKQQVRQFLEAQFKKSAGQDIESVQSAYRLFGLIPDTLDLRGFLLDLLTEQVAGYYDPGTKVLYVVKGAPSSMVTLTIQHELVHALQDQYVDLDSILNIRGDDDRQTAAQSVMEGQATLVSLEVAAGGRVNIAEALPGGWDRMRDLIRQQQNAMPLMAAAPLFIQESLLFPYLSGAEFIHQFEQREHGKEPYGDAMPTSTEQIMHPSAYFGTSRDEPTRITLPAPRGATDVYQNNLGEFATRVLIYRHVRDQNEAVRAAAGWDGDRYMLVKTPRGEGLAWFSVWDSPVDAAEFAEAMQDLIARQFANPTAQTDEAGVRRYEARGRVLTLWGGEVDGRSGVLYVDVPAGAPTTVIDPTKVTLAQ